MDHSSYIIALSLFAITVAAYLLRPDPHQPPCLPERIPYVSNTYQYITNQKRFLDRASQILQRNSIIRFNLGTTRVYLVTGAQNIQRLFKTSKSIASEAMFAQLIFPKILGMPKDEVARFERDLSGRAKVPNPGTENTPLDKRLWHASHHIYTEHLARSHSTQRLSDIYYGKLMKKLDEQPCGEWTTVRVFDFCRNQMGQAATEALFGPRIFEINPDIMKAFWEFEAGAASLFLGVPKWWNPKPYEARERFYAMVARYLDSAFDKFDWSRRDEIDWDDHFGAAVLRETAMWLKESGFADRTNAAMVAQVVFAANTNTIPITTWGIMETARDTKMFSALRQEVQQAIVTDPTTGQTSINSQKLYSLPLLQSVYVEILRRHMSFNIVREVMEPIIMEGYTIGKGSLLEAPMQIAHHEEAVWGVPGHPASEFWAERHVKYVDSKDEDGNVTQRREFSMAGRPSSFFPYGGGLPVCPGRHFAKQEIMMTLGLIVAKFDIEFVEWANMDGSLSDRAAEDNPDYAGAEAMPPDRDMKIRWKRLW
ncbi:cytochrome P450 [Xylariaceae sp. FL0016]|nr:cytochrome P450 [Xylariaceae sp. FL0016]